jgi:hypothetical protein
LQDKNTKTENIQIEKDNSNDTVDLSQVEEKKIENETEDKVYDLENSKQYTSYNTNPTAIEIFFEKV